MLFPRLNCYLITRNFDIPTECLQHINFQSLNISNSALSLSFSPSPSLSPSFTHISVLISCAFDFSFNVFRYYIICVSRVYVCVSVENSFFLLIFCEPICIFPCLCRLPSKRTAQNLILFWFDGIKSEWAGKKGKKGKREVFNEMLNGCKAFYSKVRVFAFAFTSWFIDNAFPSLLLHSSWNR